MARYQLKLTTTGVIVCRDLVLSSPDGITTAAVVGRTAMLASYVSEILGYLRKQGAIEQVRNGLQSYWVPAGSAESKRAALAQAEREKAIQRKREKRAALSNEKKLPRLTYAEDIEDPDDGIDLYPPRRTVISANDAAPLRVTAPRWVFDLERAV
jgi:hypothetical protein